MKSEKTRCPWSQGELYQAYHDDEWGVPQHDDRVLFEFLILEGAQAGLSWITILKKRDADERSRHRAQPAQDQIGGREREGVSRGAEGIRNVRPLHLVIRRRQADRRDAK